MGSIIFVHGTGVRQPRYDETFAFLKGKIATFLPGWRLARCYYGEAFGAALRRGGLSVPRYVETRKGGPSDEPSDEDAWAVLYADPLAELRWLARGATIASGAPGRVPYAQRAAENVLALAHDRDWRAQFGDAGLGDVASGALTEVASFRNLPEGVAGAVAITAVGADRQDAARETLARSIVAAAFAAAQSTQSALPDGASRDALVAATFAALGGTPAEAKGAWTSALKAALKPLAWVAKRGGTWYAKHHRGAVMDAVSPFPGDILVYLANGGPIRDFIEAQVVAAREHGPVILLAHSLGGIACVDLLAQRDLGVAGLVTAGSQAPFLCEIGALASLRPDDHLPAYFPRWLNLYDRNDLLSYIGNAMFGDGVQDVEVETRQPFPESHSAYWTCDQVWHAVKAFVA